MIWSVLMLWLIYFNPRSLAGATLMELSIRYLVIIISIHAPSRERPPLSIAKGWKPRNFNPRSLAGATPKSHFAVVYCYNFNPRSLAGATPKSHFAVVYCYNFNPRSLAGATHPANLLPFIQDEFQSTLPRGSDPYGVPGLMDHF